MTSRIRRGAVLTAVAAALSLGGAPAAHASVGVCNQASPHWLGDGLVALDPPVNSPAARYTVDLGKLPGKGAGLLDATINSPSLTICDGGDDDIVIYADDTEAEDGVDIGDGVIAIY